MENMFIGCRNCRTGSDRRFIYSSMLDPIATISKSPDYGSGICVVDNDGITFPLEKFLPNLHQLMVGLYQLYL